MVVLESEAWYPGIIAVEPGKQQDVNPHLPPPPQKKKSNLWVGPTSLKGEKRGWPYEQLFYRGQQDNDGVMIKTWRKRNLIIHSSLIFYTAKLYLFLRKRYRLPPNHKNYNFLDCELCHWTIQLKSTDIIARLRLCRICNDWHKKM